MPMKDFPTQASDYDIDDEPRPPASVISVPGPAWKEPIDEPSSSPMNESDTVTILATVASIVGLMVLALIWRELCKRFSACRQLDEKTVVASFVRNMVWLSLLRGVMGILAARVSRDVEQWVWLGFVALLVAWIQALYRTIGMMYESMERITARERAKKTE